MVKRIWRLSKRREENVHTEGHSSGGKRGRGRAAMKVTRASTMACGVQGGKSVPQSRASRTAVTCIAIEKTQDHIGSGNINQGYFNKIKSF